MSGEISVIVYGRVLRNDGQLSNKLCFQNQQGLLILNTTLLTKNILLGLSSYDKIDWVGKVGINSLGPALTKSRKEHLKTFFRGISNKLIRNHFNVLVII